MQPTAHRIPLDCNDLLWNYANDLMTYSEKDPEEKKALARKVKTDLINNFPFKQKRPVSEQEASDMQIKQTVITYKNLKAFLDCIGFSYKDMFNYLKTLNTVMKPVDTIDWPSSEAAEFYNEIKDLDDKYLNEIHQYILALLPNPIVEINNSDDTNIGRRIFYAMSVIHNESKKSSKLFNEIGGNHLNRWKQKTKDTCYNAVNLSMMPALSYETGINLHWMLQLPEDEPVLAKTGKLDCIMDDFAFIPGSEKEILINMVKNLKGEIAK